MKKVGGKLYVLKHKEFKIYKNSKLGKIFLLFFIMILILLILVGVSAECSETDNGKDYENKGTASAPEKFLFFNFISKKTDYCERNFLGAKSGNVVEYFCENGKINFVKYKCPETCEEGRCLSFSKAAELYTLGGSDDCTCACAAGTCIGSTCYDGCKWCNGAKNCGCAPNCNACAPNTCIGSTCIEPNCGTTCSGTKVCGCTPNCVYKECGNDGCGGSCGNCPSGKSCDNGICIWSCTPNCNDNNLCTSDICTNGQCTHPNINCDDNNPCTTDSCNPQTGCTHTSVPNCGCSSNNCNNNDNPCVTAQCINNVCVKTNKPDGIYNGVECKDGKPLICPTECKTCEQVPNQPGTNIRICKTDLTCSSSTLLANPNECIDKVPQSVKNVLKCDQKPNCNNGKCEYFIKLVGGGGCNFCDLMVDDNTNQCKEYSCANGQRTYPNKETGEPCTGENGEDGYCDGNGECVVAEPPVTPEEDACEWLYEVTGVCGEDIKYDLNCEDMEINGYPCVQTPGYNGEICTCVQGFDITFSDEDEMWYDLLHATPGKTTPVSPQESKIDCPCPEDAPGGTPGNPPTQVPQPCTGKEFTYCWEKYDIICDPSDASLTDEQKNTCCIKAGYSKGFSRTSDAGNINCKTDDEEEIEITNMVRSQFPRYINGKLVIGCSLTGKPIVTDTETGHCAPQCETCMPAGLSACDLADTRTSCTDNSGCDIQGDECNNGVCKETCVFDSNCGANYQCLNGFCEPKANTNTAYRSNDDGTFVISTNPNTPLTCHAFDEGLQVSCSIPTGFAQGSQPIKSFQANGWQTHRAMARQIRNYAEDNPESAIHDLIDYADENHIPPSDLVFRESNDENRVEQLSLKPANPFSFLLGKVIFSITGKAISAENYDDYLISTNNIGISGKQPYTISFFVTPGNNPEDNNDGFGRCILGFGTSYIYYDSNKKTFQTRFPGSAVNNVPGIYPEEGFYHFVEAYNGSSQQIYVNNVLVQQRNVNINSNDGKLYLGVDPFGQNRFLDGAIYNVKIFNFALTSDEISSEYNYITNSSYMFPVENAPLNSPLLYYSFEEESCDINLVSKELLKNGNAESGTTNWVGIYPILSTDKHSGTKSFSVIGSKTVNSLEFIPVDSIGSYDLDGFFKSAGTGSVSGILSFGFVPYDEKQRQIFPINVNPVAGTETTLYTDTNPSDIIIKINNCDIGWYISANRYKIAFFINDSGNYNDLPNFNVSTNYIQLVNSKSVTNTNYCEVKLVGAVGVTAKSGTKIRMHKDEPAYTYMFSAASERFVPKNWWTEYNATIQGESQTMETPIGKPTAWRRGTRYVRILGLMNINGDNTYKMLFDDVSFSVKEKNCSTKELNANDGQLINEQKQISLSQTITPLSWGYEFNGVDYIKSNKNIGISSGAFTISFWVNPKQQPYAPGYFKGGILGFGGGSEGLYISYDSKNKNFEITAGGKTNTTLGYYPENKWYHIVVKYSANRAYVYINNINKIVTKWAAPPIFSNILTLKGGTVRDSKLLIGKDSFGKAFNGTIDEVKVWNYLLSENEIGEEYKKGFYGMSLYYPFNGDFSDYSGLSNDGIAVGDSVFDAGKIGQSLKLNGNQYVNVNNSFNLGLKDEITVSAWIKTDSRNKQGIIKRGLNSQDDKNQEYALYMNRGIVYFLAGNGQSSNNLIGSGNIANNQWHLVTAVLRSNSQMEMYVDGASTLAIKKTVTGVPASDSQLIGIFWTSILGGGWNGFNGNIDEVKIFDYALSPGQIKGEYENSQKSLLVFYPFEDNYLDYSGNLNDGKLTSANPGFFAGLNNFFNGLFGG